MDTYKSLVGKRVLVTGGGRGIGREIVSHLMKVGANTIVLTKSDSSVSSLKAEYSSIEVVQVDLADWSNTRKVVESILPIDMLVNNAAIAIMMPFLDNDEKDIDDSFSVNYKAVFNVSQVVCNDLIKRGMPGAIVNVSSLSSMKAVPSASLYGSCKAAMDSLTKYMALEMGPKQIRVNAVNPTCVETDMSRNFLADEDAKKATIAGIPLGRLGEKSDVAEVVLFLLSERASLVNGVTLPVDGGHGL